MNKLSFIFMFLLAAGCVDEKLEEYGDCPPNLACTEIFLSIPITVKDGNGLPVSLDEYYTMRVENSEKIDLQNAESDPIRKANGSYPVLNDNFVSKVPFNGADFEFIGKKGGVVIVKETYKIGHDCCHIKRISGKDTATVGN